MCEKRKHINRSRILNFKRNFSFPFDFFFFKIDIYNQEEGTFFLIIFYYIFFIRCRHKRKMPNFWPCKSLPKRNGHLDTSGVSTGGHSVAYEDPDAHLHHHPLVRHHNMEVIEQKNYYFRFFFLLFNELHCFATNENDESNYTIHITGRLFKLMKRYFHTIKTRYSSEN